ncbi:MAG TPA: hypothetical protein VGB79_14100 [Allosphingosinicella sp.]|jgi:hypothetical protein
MRRALFSCFLAINGCSFAPDTKNSQQSAPPSFSNVVIIDRPDWPTPDSFATGRLVVHEACLFFETAGGERFNPIFPAGTTLRRDGAGRLTVTMHGRAVAEGQSVTVKGGSGEYGRVGSVDPSCAERNFILGGLREQDV